MDLLSGISKDSSTSSTRAAPTGTNSLNQDLLDFQRMFQTMLMAGSLGSGGLSGAGADSGLGFSGLTGSNGSTGVMMMLPMMFQMMERLLTKQMELLQSGKLSTTTDVGEAKTSTATVTTGATATAQIPAGETLHSNHASPYGQPVKGVLTQGYKGRHNGLDIGVVTGTEVHSSMDGKVTFAGWSPIGYGNLVIVQNGDYQTYYAHLSKIPVAVGDTVRAGATIGLSGSTGNSTGPHLHYEIRYKGKNIDPTSLTLGKPI